MGIYSEYLDRHLSFPDLTAERKSMLRRISELRGGRDVLVLAADLSKPNAPTSITYGDLLPVRDQLSSLQGSALDLILETPGGVAEVVEDIVRLLRAQFNHVGVIVPGWAKSAGTILAMACDEVLMEPGSALGPIDAQLNWQGKVFSADALLEGVEKIKQEVIQTGVLNKAYIPILQGISPGELQSAENAQKFSKQLVTDWLAHYKFQGWAEHSSTGAPVTDADRQARASEVATCLCDHRRWLTHGRSVGLADLEGMRLRVTDYSKQPDLADAVRRYHTLLQITFATNIYKVFETAESQIYRFIVPAGPGPEVQAAGLVVVEVACQKCGRKSSLQANLGRPQELQTGRSPFPRDNQFKCTGCGAVTDLSDLRRQIEAQAKQPVVGWV